MHLLRSVEALGFAYAGMPTAGEAFALPARAAMEVLPKLTLSLLCPRVLLAVTRPRRGFHKQIDNWLFPHVFVPPSEPDRFGVVRGSESVRAQGLLGQEVELDVTVLAEAVRIDAISSKPDQHEAIGAFVAGFQGALALAGRACAVGDEEAHFLLPSGWHKDWESAWETSKRPGELVSRTNVVPVQLSSQ